MPMPLRFGVFDQNDATGLPLGEQYENRLRLIELYDAAGFHAYHLSEHHATPLNMAPTPSVFLAAVAQRSRRLRFGPLVYLLPLHHPLRLAEEICVLDQMSGGRLEIGIGRGISPYEVAYWGLDPKTAPFQYREALEVLLRALTSDELTFSGEFYRFSAVPIVMTPVQKPHPPLWCGVATPESALWALAQKANIVCNAPADRVRPIFDAYRAGWAAAGHAASALPLLGLSRAVVIADTDAEALDIARRAWLRYHDSFHRLWIKNGGAAPLTVTPPTFDDVIATRTGIAGSPSTVRATLLAQADEATCSYLVSRFAFGDLSFAESARSVRLFEREVMPAIAA